MRAGSRHRAAAWRLCVALLLCAANLAQAASIYQPDAVKAAFLYRFTGYVDWPAEALDPASFTIAVLDADTVADELTQIVASHSIKNRVAQVRAIHSAREAQGAQMLYVGAAFNGKLRDLIESLQGRPVLVVTDRDGALDDGSMVNFLPVDRRVRFEISLTATQRAGLKVGPALLAVAANVRGGPHSAIPCLFDGAVHLPDAACGWRVASL